MSRTGGEGGQLTIGEATLAPAQRRALVRMTQAERQAFLAVEGRGWQVREYARETDRAPGTVGTLLRRARDKVGDRA